METSLIEKLDKSRYDLIRWFTVGWIVWFGAFIAKDYIRNTSLLGTLLFAGLIGWIFFTVSLVKCLRLGKQINADRDLKAALSNEMHQFYMHKSFVWGFWMSIITACCLIIISTFFQVAALLVGELVLFVGVTSALIAHLIYNRE